MVLNCEEIKRNYPDCVTCTSNSKVQVAENKRKYILQNPSRKEVCRVRVDGCLISSEDRRKCDFMIIVCPTKDVYLIELKGNKLLDAIEQLSQTLSYFNSQFLGKIYARIVLSKVQQPKAMETDGRVVKFKKRLKKTGGDLIYSSRVYEGDSV
ncbi:MAG: hypothetical protein AB4372_27630 [Xenococcus sp. (in: cyanobacteria)]